MGGGRAGISKAHPYCWKLMLGLRFKLVYPNLHLWWDLYWYIGCLPLNFVTWNDTLAPLPIVLVCQSMCKMFVQNQISCTVSSAIDACISYTVIVSLMLLLWSVSLHCYSFHIFCGSSSGRMACLLPVFKTASLAVIFKTCLPLLNLLYHLNTIILDGAVLPKVAVKFFKEVSCYIPFIKSQ